MRRIGLAVVLTKLDRIARRLDRWLLLVVALCSVGSAREVGFYGFDSTASVRLPERCIAQTGRDPFLRWSGFMVALVARSTTSRGHPGFETRATLPLQWTAFLPAAPETYVLIHSTQQ